MTSFLIESTLTNPKETNYASLLKQAYEKKIRPLCLCKIPNPSMYIAQYGDDYILKKMPNSGSTHHPNCALFDMPTELSGRGSIESQAIEQGEEGTRLKVDFSLTKEPTARAPSSGSRTQKAEVKASPKKLSIRAVLHYLYEEAGLNKWYPAMAGKRNWYVIRYNLLLAAKDKSAKTHNLDDILLIPETFNREKIADIQSHRSTFIKQFRSKPKEKIPLGLFIGELKNLEKSRFDYKLLIKHMPDKPLYMSEESYKRINNRFNKELSFINEDKSLHLLVIGTFLLSPSDNLHVETISLMLVDQNWLPFETALELQLIDKLVAEKRSFIKGMRYNLPEDNIIASALLIDCENPVPIYIIPETADENDIQALNEVITESEFESIIWDHTINDVFQLPVKTNATI